MEIEFVRAWQQYSVGDRITPTSAAYAETLVLSGKCKPVREKITLKAKDDNNASNSTSSRANNNGRGKNKPKHRNNRR